jgi:hypothetical protein
MAVVGGDGHPSSLNFFGGEFPAGASRYCRKSTSRSEGCPSPPIDRFGGDFLSPEAWGGMRVRVRWSRAGVVLLGVAAAALALRVGPGLLTPPAPPPLPADVGLPQTKAPPPSSGRSSFRIPEGSATPRRPRRSKARIGRSYHRYAERTATSRRAVGMQRATRISSRPRVRPRARQRQMPAPDHTTTAPPPIPAPEPEPPPEAPPPAVSAPPPNDGSMEFAPH